MDKRLYTVDDLVNLSDVDKHYELAKGVLIEMLPTRRPHTLVTMELARLLGNHIRPNKLGELAGPDAGFILGHNPDTLRTPDIAFVSKARLSPVEDSYYSIAPDLAIEVIETETDGDIQTRIAEYFQAGTRLMWIVYPKTRSIDVYHSFSDISLLSADDTLYGGDVLPGFLVKVRDLFSVLD